MASRHLRGLGLTAAWPQDRLDHLIRDGGNAESIRALPEDEITEVVNRLGDVLGGPDRAGQRFRMCLLVLQKISSVWGILPVSYRISEDISFATEQPAAFGGFSDVFRGKVARVDVCIKKIRVCSNSNVNELTQLFCKEAVMWKHLNHPNIVPFVGVTFEPLQLVSEWMAGGELRDYIKNNPNADLNSLVLGVAEGLAYLHSHDVIHGDLKGPNILVDESGTARIADFGGATFVQDPCAAEKDWHTVRWCAPELHLDDQPATKGSDIFSFGMVIIEVFTGKAPFSEYKSPQVIATVLTGKIPERPGHPSFTDALWELTQQCLRHLPSERPRAKQVLVTLKDVDGGREVSHNQVDTPLDETDETSSLINTCDCTPWKWQLKNGGTKPPKRGHAGTRYTSGKLDNESGGTGGDLQNTKSNGLFATRGNQATPPHIHVHKRQESAEKLPLSLHVDRAPGTFLSGHTPLTSPNPYPSAFQNTPNPNSTPTRTSGYPEETRTVVSNQKTHLSWLITRVRVPGVSLIIQTPGDG